MPVAWSKWVPSIEKHPHKKEKMTVDKGAEAVSSGKSVSTKSDEKTKSPWGEAATLELSNNQFQEKNSLKTNMLATTKTTSSRTMKVGSSGDDVYKLQENLNKLGYNTGKPDGKYGNGTKSAVAKFQILYGISSDGIAGVTTQDAITKSINRMNSGILSRGQISNDVKILQNNLITLGYLSGNADGQFGAGTESAVKAFQKAYKLSQDGLAGKETRSKITEVIKKNNSITPVAPSNGKVTRISNGETMSLPRPGETIDVSLGTDKPSTKAKVKSTNAWSIEYSINGCKRTYGETATCTKRLESAINQFSYNAGEYDLLKLNVPEFGTCYAGAMVEGFGKIGDIAEVTLDDGQKFNFMILDTKSTSHKSSELSPNNQCQNKYGHGYMSNNNTQVQLSVCEFITSQSASGISSAMNYPSGSFLNGRYVANAKIVGHASIE